MIFTLCCLFALMARIREQRTTRRRTEVHTASASWYWVASFCFSMLSLSKSRICWSEYVLIMSYCIVRRSLSTSSPWSAENLKALPWDDRIEEMNWASLLAPESSCLAPRPKSRLVFGSGLHRLI